jgi:hypothetical protein
MTISLLNQHQMLTKAPPFPLSSRPGFPATQHWTKPRVRLSLKERRMRSASATNLNRKSGGSFQPASNADQSPPTTPLSSRPGFPATQHWTKPRVRLSLKERRMRSASATNLNRKSGGAKPRDLQFFQSASNADQSTALPFVIPSEAEGPAVRNTLSEGNPDPPTDACLLE